MRVHGDHDDLLPPNDSVLVDSTMYINYLNNYRPHHRAGSIPASGAILFALRGRPHHAAPGQLRCVQKHTILNFMEDTRASVC
ncbi:MAG: hypothetical protein IPH53_18055 [Flavobacteriales bacterium]|nr:hypothetical protein [Flavobacteriales bacterium]